MQNTSNINLDDLIQQIRIFNPSLSCDEQADRELRQKLNEQVINGSPQVMLEQKDLKCIIMNVKKSLSEFQKRIDESVAQQQLRRTTRVRKTIVQDPKVMEFFNSGRYDRQVSTTSCSNSKRCNHVTELEGLVEVESLPVSASTNLITIFVPTILEQQMHCTKFKISIDLNRMDLTKKIIGLNLGQHVNASLENETKAAVRSIENDITNKNEQDCKITYELHAIATENSVDGKTVIHTPITNNGENNPKIEIKISPNTTESSASSPAISVVADAVESPASKKRSIKRKDTKPLLICPPKKRGRKPGSKNKKKDEKSELAKYVEMFACNTGSPSAVSQIVTSTTQNWEIIPDQGEPIAYFMNGEWTTFSAPSNGGSQLVSTTNGAVNLDEPTNNGQDTFIPFEDFVDFIDNPSLDAANVIARVLEAAADPPTTNTLNSQQCAEISQENKSNEKINSVQETQLPSKSADGSNLNIVHSTVVSRKENTTDEALNLSREYNVSFNVNVLDLTQKKTNDTTYCREGESPSKEETSKTVVFSTSRSMPLLDDMEVEVSHQPATPAQTETDILQTNKRIVFSMEPHTSPTVSNKSCLGGGSIADSAIEMDKTEMVDYALTTSTSSKDKSQTETIKEMSLLEIEKDIDDSMLDFDNCLDDDLLSLAPSSCFNSPNDDRFVSDFMENSNANTSTLFDSSTPAPRSQLELSFPKLKNEEFNQVLNNFKIPRVKQITEAEPSKEVKPAKAPRENLIIQQVINYIPSTSVSSVNPGGGPSSHLFSMLPDFITLDSSCTKSTSAIIVTAQEISKLFGNLCYDFLADKCFLTTCESRHQLLEDSAIMLSLSSLPNETLHLAYTFIWRHHKLFKYYFPIFCQMYARRNMRHKLSKMITDCVLQPNCLAYLKNVYSALLCSGLNGVNACRFILKLVKERTHVAINILVEIIIDSDAAMFVHSLDEFSQVDGYTFRMVDINRLATACWRSSSPELLTVLIKCLISVDRTEYLTMQSPELKRLVDKIKGDIM